MGRWMDECEDIWLNGGIDGQMDRYMVVDEGKDSFQKSQQSQKSFKF